MDTMSIYIDETLAKGDINNLKDTLCAIPHVVNVELNPFLPHIVTVDYEEHFNIPVIVLNKLSNQGLHPDIQLC